MDQAVAIDDERKAGQLRYGTVPPQYDKTPST